MSSSSTLRFHDGATQFRLRLACSLLSHRPIVLTNIRADELERSPGLLPHEASFLRLLDSITNGTKMEINSTGTQLRFVPGALTGTPNPITHVCPNDRNVGWFLEGLLYLAPFGKEPLDVTLEGVTEGTGLDLSADYVATAVVPLYGRFGVGVLEEEEGGQGPQCRVLRRGAAPLGGGRVRFTCPIVKEVLPVDWTDVGRFKRIRGSAISCKMAPSMANRTAHAAKGLLHRLLPDVWIHTDTHSARHARNPHGCGDSPGLSLCIAAESTEGVVLCVEAGLDPHGRRGDELPEDLGVKGAALVLEEIRRGGCVDTSAQTLAFFLMCLGPEDVARIRVGTLSQHSIVALRLLRDVFGIEFKVRPDPDTKTVLLSCLGSGYRNMVKAST